MYYVIYAFSSGSASVTACKCIACIYIYRVFRAQTDWTFILPSELPAKELRHLAEKNAAPRHQVLRSLISLYNEHRVYVRVYIHTSFCNYRKCEIMCIYYRTKCPGRCKISAICRQTLSASMFTARATKHTSKWLLYVKFLQVL
jgi:hypothetical protein